MRPAPWDATSLTIPRVSVSGACEDNVHGPCDPWNKLIVNPSAIISMDGTLTLSKGFSTLECELLSRRSSMSQAQARVACFTSIEGFHNPHRLHSGLGYRLLADYERRHHMDRVPGLILQFAPVH